MDAAECKMNSKRRRSHSPVEHKDGRTKDSENSGRKDCLRDLENDTSNARSGRGHEFVRHSDRHSSGASHESKSRDDHRRYHDKHADGNDRSHRTSRSERESRADTYYDRSKRDNTSDRSRGDWRNNDSRYGDKPARREHWTKSQEKQESSLEYHRYDCGEYEKYPDGGKQAHNTRKYPEEKESKKKFIQDQEEALKKRSGKEIEKNISITEPEFETREKRRSLFSSVGPDVENVQLNEKSDISRKKPSVDCSGDLKPTQTLNGVLDNSASGFKEGGTVNSVDAAKVAAMKAAEFVNKNLVGFGVGTGCLSTDQKKKLLWGNKKSNPPESSTHWDSNLFSDRERQEKFNKLMSLRVPWWLWPIIVGSEEQQHLSPSPREHGRQQGWELIRCQEAGGARHRSGEALHSRPAQARWSNRWSWPVGCFYCIGELRSSFCRHVCCHVYHCVRMFNWAFTSPKLLFVLDALITVRACLDGTQPGLSTSMAAILVQIPGLCMLMGWN